MVQLGQTLGLFRLPGGRPRPFLGSGASNVSALGVKGTSEEMSGSGPMGTGSDVGVSEVDVSEGLLIATGIEVGGRRLPSTTSGTSGRSSRGDGVGKVIGNSCSLSKT